MIEPNTALVAASVLLTVLVMGMGIGALVMRAAARRDAEADGTVTPSASPASTPADVRASAVRLMGSWPNGCVHVFSRDLRVQMAEGEGLTRFGLERGQAGQPLRQGFPRDAAQRLEPALRRALLGHRDRFEMTLAGVPVLAACGPLGEESGPAGSVILILQDISEQRARLDAMEAARRQAEARMTELAATDRDLETFASNATRDLRDPLRLLAAYLAVIRQRHARVLDQDGLALLRQAEEGARRMDRSLRDVLEYAALDGVEAPRRPVALAEAVGRALRDLIVPLQESGGQVDIRDPLPTVRGAPDQIQRLFRAVLGNALRHRRAGCTPIITIGCEEEDGTFWRLCIQDNGPGVPADERQALFEPLRRRSATSVEDSGMSLAIARRIVEAHGGRIWVMPTAVPAPPRNESGTTLCFTLPIDPTAGDPPAALAVRLGLGR
ncbi:MAG: ATP-binding protein [Rhodospirillaceae bacterium]